MNLSLARWEYKGSSRGCWMVRELPSTIICLASGGRGWLIQCGVDLFDGFEEDAVRVWGKDYESLTRHLPDPSLKQCYYPTRSAALLSLQASFPSCHDSALCEVLS